MLPNYPVTEQVGTAFKLRQRMKNFRHVFTFYTKTLNLAILHCYLTEHAKEINQNL